MPLPVTDLCRKAARLRRYAHEQWPSTCCLDSLQLCSWLVLLLVRSCLAQRRPPLSAAEIKRQCPRPRYQQLTLLVQNTCTTQEETLTVANFSGHHSRELSQNVWWVPSPQPWPPISRTSWWWACPRRKAAAPAALPQRSSWPTGARRSPGLPTRP